MIGTLPWEKEKLGSGPEGGVSGGATMIVARVWTVIVDDGYVIVESNDVTRVLAAEANVLD